MIDGFIAPPLRDIDYLTPSAPYPATPSGININQKSIYRYSVPIDEQPIITILNYIPDYNGNFIKPGHYKLALSDDKNFLYLIEIDNLIAIIPVFKIDENKQELKKYYNSKKQLSKEEKKKIKKQKQKNKLQNIIDKKYAKTGATPPQKYEYMNATIDYYPKDNYYLIMYEKGFIRAWGAIKINN